MRVIFDDDVRNREYPRYSPQVTVREVSAGGDRRRADLGPERRRAPRHRRHLRHRRFRDRDRDLRQGGGRHQWVPRSPCCSARRRRRPTAPPPPTRPQWSVPTRSRRTTPPPTAWESRRTRSRSTAARSTRPAARRTRPRLPTRRSEPPVRPLGGRHTPDTGHDRQQFSQDIRRRHEGDPDVQRRTVGVANPAGFTIRSGQQRRPRRRARNFRRTVELTLTTAD